MLGQALSSAVSSHDNRLAEGKQIVCRFERQATMINRWQRHGSEEAMGSLDLEAVGCD